MTEKEPLSEMEQIRLRSVDPVFASECDVAVKRTRETLREVEYDLLLVRQASDKVNLRDKARVGFEAECN